MRILLISHTCQSSTEGQPKAHVLGMTPEIDLHVLVPDRWLHYGKWRAPEAPPDASFKMITGKIQRPWSGPAQWYFHTYQNLKDILDELRPDVVDLWEEPWNYLSDQVCRLRDRYYPEMRIVSETEQNIDKHLPFPFEQYRSRTLRSADYLIGRSIEAVKVVRDKGYTGPAAIVPNAVDDSLFRPQDRDACRRELGLSGFVVGYVGRVVPEKGLVDVIDMLAFAPEQVNVLIVGDGPIREELELHATTVGVSSRVKFLSGRSLDELPRIMGAMDTLVLPSRTTQRWKEQFGRVLIEAQSCGIPVIGSDSGAIPDVVGGAGLVVPEGEPLALAHAVRDLLYDQPLLDEMGSVGRQQVAERYTWYKVARNMVTIYEDVLRRPVSSQSPGRPQLPPIGREPREISPSPDFSSFAKG
ncbi:MAG: glycosyltransferase family 4 protein [Capsulimonadaceae bacterium]|nr:glycosyltransferase family 4 protein [Capsulimonadaceae bacterium]